MIWGYHYFWKHPYRNTTCPPLAKSPWSTNQSYDGLNSISIPSDTQQSGKLVKSNFCNNWLSSMTCRKKNEQKKHMSNEKQLHQGKSVHGKGPMALGLYKPYTIPYLLGSVSHVFLPSGKTLGCLGLFWKLCYPVGDHQWPQPISASWWHPLTSIHEQWKKPGPTWLFEVVFSAN